MTRVEDKAIHFVPTPLDPDAQVDVAVDWGRRFDHMQQHSGEEDAVNGTLLKQASDITRFLSSDASDLI